MPFQTPGVYVQEVSSGIKPIQGVSTSNGGFVGLTRKGPVNKPVLITNWTQFVKAFGSVHHDYFMPYSVYNFFYEGGAKCYCVRVLPKGWEKATAVVTNAEGAALLDIIADNEGDWANNLTLSFTENKEKEEGTFDLTIWEKRPTVPKPVELEYYEKLDMKSLAKLESPTIDIAIVGEGLPALGDTEMAGGSCVFPDTPEDIDDAEFLGTSANKKGLHALDDVDDVNIICVPDQAGDREVMKAGIDYCINRKDCFFVADPPPALGVMEVEAWGNKIKSPAGFGALYYPWIQVMDPDDGSKLLVPPSGAMIGTYAHTDTTRGVHKAPAGTSEGFLNCALDVEKALNDAEQGGLNSSGVNVIRSFVADGICAWGARTISNDAEWRYINVRRLFLYVEETILKASKWAVFEPNDPKLWGTVNRNLTAFLTMVWRSGALFGSSPDQAFYVKIDSENNPQENIDAGELNIEIGIAPVKPAEFIIIKISQKAP